ncbi:hypothetical protein BESB_066470 [Besnoitia besnoiti]|uniref:Uncharacterized protein n=1 Tax=Besnoitia besnoiti TaxID=94643 RepID=A0A2A9MBL6_BESBE|nr:hypothetical protein BESB_066470 [Besnoitia besnoiti]PFH34614.1 hypothetical protein BESB_066470 [Besnoitia besnoiti]
MEAAAGAQPSPARLEAQRGFRYEHCETLGAENGGGAAVVASGKQERHEVEAKKRRGSRGAGKDDELREEAVAVRYRGTEGSREGAPKRDRRGNRENGGNAVAGKKAQGRRGRRGRRAKGAHDLAQEETEGEGGATNAQEASSGDEDAARARGIEQVLREAADEAGAVEAMIAVAGGLRIRRTFRLSELFRSESRAQARANSPAAPRLQLEDEEAARQTNSSKEKRGEERGTREEEMGEAVEGARPPTRPTRALRTTAWGLPYSRKERNLARAAVSARRREDATEEDEGTRRRRPGAVAAAEAEGAPDAQGQGRGEGGRPRRRRRLRVPSPSRSAALAAAREACAGASGGVAPCSDAENSTQEREEIWLGEGNVCEAETRPRRNRRTLASSDEEAEFIERRGRDAQDAREGDEARRREAVGLSSGCCRDGAEEPYAATERPQKRRAESAPSRQNYLARASDADETGREEGGRGAASSDSVTHGRSVLPPPEKEKKGIAEGQGYRTAALRTEAKRRETRRAREDAKEKRKEFVCLRLLSAANLRLLLQRVPSEEFELHGFLSSARFIVTASPRLSQRRKRHEPAEGAESFARGEAENDEAGRATRSAREASASGTAQSAEAFEGSAPAPEAAEGAMSFSHEGTGFSSAWKSEGDVALRARAEGSGDETQPNLFPDRAPADPRGSEAQTQNGGREGGKHGFSEAPLMSLFAAGEESALKGGESGSGRSTVLSRLREGVESFRARSGEDERVRATEENSTGRQDSQEEEPSSWRQAVVDAKKLWIGSLLRPKMIAIATHLLEANGRDADLFSHRRFASFSGLQAAFLRAVGSSAAPEESPSPSSPSRFSRRCGEGAFASRLSSPAAASVLREGSLFSLALQSSSFFISAVAREAHAVDATALSSSVQRGCGAEHASVSLLTWTLREYLTEGDLCRLMCTCRLLRQELSHCAYWPSLVFRPLSSASSVSARGRRCRPSAEAQQEKIVELLSQPRFFSARAAFAAGEPTSRLRRLRLEMHLGASFGPSLHVTAVTCLHKVAAVAPNLVFLDLTGCEPLGAWCDGRSLLLHLRHLFPSLRAFVTSRGVEVAVSRDGPASKERGNSS